MVKVVFWRTGDTVVNCNDAGETFEILTAENRQAGVWVVLKNYHTQETRSGFEQGFQRLGYVAYRQDSTAFTIYTV